MSVEYLTCILGDKTIPNLSQAWMDGDWRKENIKKWKNPFLTHYNGSNLWQDKLGKGHSFSAHKCQCYSSNGCRDSSNHLSSPLIPEHTIEVGESPGNHRASDRWLWLMVQSLVSTLSPCQKLGDSPWYLEECWFPLPALAPQGLDSWHRKSHLEPVDVLQEKNVPKPEGLWGRPPCIIKYEVDEKCIEVTLQYCWSCLPGRYCTTMYMYKLWIYSHFL